MEKNKSRSRIALTNLLLSLAISLLINFSFLLILFDTQTNDYQHRRRHHPTDQELTVPIASEGTLHILPDGYGYILFEDEAIDSVYVNSGKIWRYRLNEGDKLKIKAAAPASEGAHYAVRDIVMLNGEPFDYGARFDKPDTGSQTALQLIGYALLSFILFTILTRRSRNRKWHRYILPHLACLLIVAAFYFAAPIIGVRADIPRGMIDMMLILKCSFVLVVAILYGRIFELIYQRQRMAIENEQLKNENLSSRYSILVSQISPHFLFNSLNSLSMLVREQHTENALAYIDRLSYVFRYIIQNGQNTLTTLADELQFLDAYRYLLEVRYADKLFFDIDIDPRCERMTLPSLSLQPLIENAVKHNTITRTRPLHISIRTEGNCVSVSNPIIPKIQTEQSTGIGLKNLSSRWKLITDKTIQIVRTDSTFEVRLPLGTDPDIKL